MKRKNITTKEKKIRFELLAEMGCMICGAQAQIHHCKGLEFGTGIALKAQDDKTFPLCEHHHTGREGFHTIGKKTWERLFGSQRSFLNTANLLLEEK